MRLPRMMVSRRLGRPLRITVCLLAFALCSALPAAAQTGVIAFRDYCRDLLHVMRADGGGSTALQLPALPGRPTSTNTRTRGCWMSPQMAPH